MEQSLDELECETDVGVRKQVKKTYNLARENFDSLREFQDYEEEVEDIIGVDITTNIVNGTTPAVPVTGSFNYSVDFCNL